jgi:hypothetical protein
MSEDVKATKKDPRYPVSEESAEEQYQKFLDFCEIYEDDETESAEAAKNMRAEMIKAIRMGRVEIGDEAKDIVKQRLKNGATLTWDANRLGLAKKKMPIGKLDDMANGYRKNYSVAEIMTKSDPGKIMELGATPRDLSILEVIASLFVSI